MAEHHALLSVHNEVIAPPMVDHLPSYRQRTEVTGGQLASVGKNVSHSVSDHLSQRYPYPAGARYNFSEPTVAYGRQGVNKTIMVLTQLVDEASDSPAAAEVKRANISKLLEALYDHTVIADSLAGPRQSENVGLLKNLLVDPDPDVRKGAAECLGRFSTLLQGRKAICDSGCAESLASMLEDFDSADVRLAAGKTLLILVQSIDGKDEVADNVSDGRVVVKMVKALLQISAARSTPGLVEVLLEALASLLKAEKAIELALEAEIMPFIVYTLKRRKHTIPALKTLVSLCGLGQPNKDENPEKPDGKRAAIDAGALSAICGLLASENPVERQLSARAVLLMCVDQEGKRRAAVVVPNLIMQLYETDHDMYMNALLAVRTISEWPDTRAVVIQTLRDDSDMHDQIFSDHQIHLASFRYEPNKPPRI